MEYPDPFPPEGRAPGFAQALADRVWTLSEHGPVKLAAGALGLAAAVALLLFVGQRYSDRERRLAEARDHTQPAPGVALTLVDGPGKLEVMTDGTIPSLSSLPPSEREQVERALRYQELPPPAHLSEVLEGRSGAETPVWEYGLLAPVATATPTDRPEFRWQPLPLAARYQVRVYDRENQEMFASPSVEGTVWRAPQPLPREQVYRWTITAQTPMGHVTLPRPPAPEARFYVLDIAGSRAIEQRAAVHRGRRLALGVLFGVYGMRDEAEAELQELLTRNPASGEVKRLLESVRGWR